jgi:hypothetical protein
MLKVGGREQRPHTRYGRSAVRGAVIAWGAVMSPRFELVRVGRGCGCTHVHATVPRQYCIRRVSEQPVRGYVAH